MINRGQKAIKHNAENLSAAVDVGVQTYREALETHSVEQRKSVSTAPVRAESCRPAKKARAP